jgi:hypothetical protein
LIPIIYFLIKDFVMKKLFSHLLFFTIITYTHDACAMLNSKFASMASSKISTAARRTHSHFKHTPHYTAKEFLIEGTKGIIGGSVGTATGFVCGGAGAILLGAIIIPPCHIADINVTISDIESFTCPPCVAAGALIGSAVAGGVPGVAGYGLLLATSYAIGKYKAQK